MKYKYELIDKIVKTLTYRDLFPKLHLIVLSHNIYIRHRFNLSYRAKNSHRMTHGSNLFWDNVCPLYYELECMNINELEKIIFDYIL